MMGDFSDILRSNSPVRRAGDAQPFGRKNVNSSNYEKL